MHFLYLFLKRLFDMGCALLGLIVLFPLALIVMLGIGLALQSRQPKDTFDDPLLAYAQVQEVFQKISSGVQQGRDAVTESTDMISSEMEKTINKIR